VLIFLDRKGAKAPLPDMAAGVVVLVISTDMGRKQPRVIFRVFKLNPGRLAGSFQEHRGIAGAVLKGDAALAARRVEEYLDRGKRCLVSPREQGPP